MTRPVPSVGGLGCRHLYLAPACSHQAWKLQPQHTLHVLAPSCSASVALPGSYMLRQPYRPEHNCRSANSEGSPEPSSNSAYDPKLAAGFQAPPGEPTLWWVEKYEQRRKELASRSRSKSRFSTGPSSDSSQTEPATPTIDSPPGTGATPAIASAPADGVSSHLQAASGSNDNGSASSKGQADKPAPRGWLAAAVQAVQLTVVLWMLIGFPASLQPGGVYALRMWLLLGLYWIFFALGGVRRQLKYGALASRQRDKQTSSWGSRARLLLFIACIVILHWGCMLRLKSLYYLAADTWYEVLGTLTAGCALWLHDKATQQLGSAYDRVVAPERLVTTGVYAHVQHPIYTSYMLLFCGYALLLHSAPLAFMFILVCLLHYSHRTQLEAQVLAAKFGEQYLAYTSKTRMFIPLLY